MTASLQLQKQIQILVNQAHLSKTKAIRYNCTAIFPAFINATMYNFREVLIKSLVILEDVVSGGVVVVVLYCVMLTGVLVTPLPTTCCLCPSPLQVGPCSLGCWRHLLGHLAALYHPYHQLLLFLQQNVKQSVQSDMGLTCINIFFQNRSTLVSPSRFASVFWASLNEGHSLPAFGKWMSPFGQGP